MIKGNHCGSFGGAVASNTRGPRFKSDFYTEHVGLSTVEKTKIKKKGLVMVHLKMKTKGLQKWISSFSTISAHPVLTTSLC